MINDRGSVGEQSDGAVFSGGSSIIPTRQTGLVFYEAFGFFAGAAPGINYARFDLNGDDVYETVIEFDFGLDEAFSGDLITRYAYEDSPNTSLDIPEAVIEFNRVPEPSASFLILLGAFLSCNYRRRVISN